MTEDSSTDIDYLTERIQKYYSFSGYPDLSTGVFSNPKNHALSYVTDDGSVYRDVPEQETESALFENTGAITFYREAGTNEEAYCGVRISVTSEIPEAKQNEQFAKVVSQLQQLFRERYDSPTTVIREGTHSIVVVTTNPVESTGVHQIYPRVREDIFHDPTESLREIGRYLDGEQVDFSSEWFGEKIRDVYNTLQEMPDEDAITLLADGSNVDNEVSGGIPNIGEARAKEVVDAVNPMEEINSFVCKQISNLDTVTSYHLKKFKKSEWLGRDEWTTVTPLSQNGLIPILGTISFDGGFKVHEVSNPEDPESYEIQKDYYPEPFQNNTVSVNLCSTPVDGLGSDVEAKQEELSEYIAMYLSSTGHLADDPS